VGEGHRAQHRASQVVRSPRRALDEFRRPYREELDAKPGASEPILEASRHRAVTLLYSARDTATTRARRRALARARPLDPRRGLSQRTAPGARIGVAERSARCRSPRKLKLRLPRDGAPRCNATVRSSCCEFPPQRRSRHRRFRLRGLAWALLQRSGVRPRSARVRRASRTAGLARHARVSREE
jgi:hypothetical protein